MFFLCAALYIPNVHAISTSNQASARWTDVRQRITGFGACCAWTDLRSSAAVERKKIFDDLFSADSGVGFSMIRLQQNSNMEPSKGTWDFSRDQGQIDFVNEAKKRGEMYVWSAPWSPPAWMKSGNRTQGSTGGSLKPECYQDFADYQSRYIREYKATYGIDIRAISVQNEPHFASPWDGCPYTPDQIRDYIKNNLGPTLKRDGVTAKIMMPESNWDQRGWATSTVNDATASSYTGIAAFHKYDHCAYINHGSCNFAPYPEAKAKGMELWQTECSLGAMGSDLSDDAMMFVFELQQLMTEAEINAWHYWWFISQNGSWEGLILNGTRTKLLWCIGQWSKFIRPGWQMLGMSEYEFCYPSIAPNNLKVLLSAFKDSTSGKFAIVAVNLDKTEPHRIFINMNGFRAASVTPWLTDATNNLARKSDIACTGGTIDAMLPIRSVMTFTGIGTPVAATDVDVDSFVSSPGTIVSGKQSSLAWSTKNATSVSIDQGIGTVAAVGNATVSPTQTTTYTLTAQGPNGPVVRKVTVTLAQARDPENPSPFVNGVSYRYYEGNWGVQMPNFSSLTAKSSGNSTNFFATVPGSIADYYGIRYTAYVEAPSDGIYTFSLECDDGAKLYIGNQLLINKDGAYVPGEAAGTIGLKTGRHAITVEYMQITGGKSLNVRWSSTDVGIPKQLIPANRLFIPGTPANAKAFILRPFAEYPLSIVRKHYGLELRYTVPGASAVRLEIVDRMGRCVWAETRWAGRGVNRWDLPLLSAGSYAGRLTCENVRKTIRFIEQ